MAGEQSLGGPLEKFGNEATVLRFPRVMQARAACEKTKGGGAYAGTSNCLLSNVLDRRHSLSSGVGLDMRSSRTSRPILSASSIASCAASSEPSRLVKRVISSRAGADWECRMPLRRNLIALARVCASIGPSQRAGHIKVWGRYKWRAPGAAPGGRRASSGPVGRAAVGTWRCGSSPAPARPHAGKRGGGANAGTSGRIASSVPGGRRGVSCGGGPDTGLSGAMRPACPASPRRPLRSRPGTGRARARLPRGGELGVTHAVEGERHRPCAGLRARRHGAVGRGGVTDARRGPHSRA